MTSEVSAPQPPSRARLVVAFWLCALAAVLYLCRMCLGQVAQPIQTELDLSNKQFSYILIGFMVAYGFFAAPIGRLGDRYGSRIVLTVIVVSWSIFTALTGTASDLAMLIAFQFFFGFSEAGTFPNTARVISRWFPLGERGRVQGLLLASAQLGAVAAPIAAAYLIEAHGWRWVFPGFAILSLSWAVGFCIWFRDNPANHPSVNPAELAVIRSNAPPPPSDPGPVPWREVLTHRGIIFLGLIIILSSFYSYLFYSWFPKYLSAGRGLDNLETGRYASILQGGAAVGVLLGGWIADRIPRWSRDVILARRKLCAGSFLVSAVFLFIGVRSDDPLVMTILFACSFCAMQIANPNWWSVIIPQAGRHVGALFGLTNGIGGIGAMASQFFVGAFADWQKARGLSGREQWDPLFDVYVVVLVLGAAAWWLYRYRPLSESPQADEEGTG